MEKKNLFEDQVDILKHWGLQNNLKVVVKEIDGNDVILICDFEFYSFESALRFLQHDSKSIVRAQEEVVL